MIGIYCIENTINNKKYIGQATDIQKRFSVHIKKLTDNNHINRHLQLSWNKHGGENFLFYVLEICKNENHLTEKEQFWIGYYNTLNNNFGYNKREAGSKGRLSQETKNRIGESNKNHPPTRECIEKALLARKNIIYSEERRKAISKSNSERTISEKTRKKISLYRKGKKHSEKSISLMREIKSGENNPNFGKKRINSSSRFFGVYYNKKRKKWVTQITINKKTIFLGYFKKEEDAAKTYDYYIISSNLNNPLNFLYGGENG